MIQSPFLDGVIRYRDESDYHGHAFRSRLLSAVGEDEGGGRGVAGRDSRGNKAALLLLRCIFPLSYFSFSSIQHTRAGAALARPLMMVVARHSYSKFRVTMPTTSSLTSFVLRLVTMQVTSAVTSHTSRYFCLSDI